jgi:xanthine dehydrogenase D subunit
MPEGDFEVLQPRTAEEAMELFLRGGSRFVGGGTSLQLEWAAGQLPPKRLIDLGRITGMQGMVWKQNEIHAGALVTLAALERDAAISEKLPLLAAAIRTVAAPAIRTLATIGGNLAGRSGCLLPALLALDACVQVFEPAGRRTLPLGEWLLVEVPAILETVIVPLCPRQLRWTHRKIGLRAAFTPSVIAAGGLIELEGGRIVRARLAVGGGPVTPARLMRSESAVTGQNLSEIDWAGLHTSIAEEISAPSDAFRSGRYRRIAAANTLIHGLGGFLKYGRVPSTGRSIPAPKLAPKETRLERASAGGRWQIRPDGPAKIAGKFLYLTDPREPGMLVARILRANIAHAKILSIDTSAAEALPGVAAVATFRDVPGLNGFGIMIQDQPAFCEDKVRHEGDAVAAVAAADARTAAAALDLIRVEYEPLPAITNPRAALRPEAPKIHDSGNLLRALDFNRGDAGKGFSGSAHMVAAVYTTPRQMHAFMETEGGHAFVDAEGILNVCAGGQHGSRDRLQLSRILAIPEEKIRVVTSPTGGAFGGKDELTVQPALAILALKTGRKVRLHLDRAESVLAGIKRHPMTIHMRTRCDARGYLIAQEVEVLADGGAYASLGPSVLETALEHACGPYRVDNVKASGKLVYTNNGVCGAFRGFGANQMTFAVECQMDRLAAACGLDPFEIRKRNLRTPGSPGSLGQKVAPSERLFEMLQASEADPVWRQPRGLLSGGTELTGIGMAMNYQGNGLGTLPPDHGAGSLRLAADGAIEALYGLDEIGQGLLPAIRAAVSRELGCAAGDVRPVIGDTGLAPDSGSTTASRGTYVIWKAATAAAPELREKILQAAALILKRDTSSLAIAAGGVALHGANRGELLISFKQLAGAMAGEDLPSAAASFQYPKTEYLNGNARYIFAFGATLARVAVNRITGQVRVLDLIQHTAAGPALDVASYLGQIEGGGIQGLGFTLSEHAPMENCRYITRNLDTYMLPTAADAPQSMVVHALEELDESDPFGPRGVGELGIGAVTPAIANAVADAIGAWPDQTPFDPEQILFRMGTDE